jgi:nitric oxide reductase large subunit
VLAQVSLIDEQIKIEKENIDANRKIINQLDSQVDQLLSRSTTEAGAVSSTNTRARQAKERQAAQKEILSSQAKINKLNTDKAPIAAQVREVEAEVGPVKYIAALIYGDNPEANVLEKSVRWVILLIVFVFDPLAVLMFVAYNQTTMRQRPAVQLEVQLDPVPEPKPLTEMTQLEPIGDGEHYHLSIGESVRLADNAKGHHENSNTGLGHNIDLRTYN